MSILTNNPARIAALCGFDSWRHSLPPKLGIDQFRTVLPVLVANDDGPSVIITKEIDRANVEAIVAPPVRFLFHSPYFSFDRAERPSDARPTLAAAVAEVADSRTELDRSLSVSLYSLLANQLGTPASPGVEFPPPTYHYLVPRATVWAQSVDGRDDALAAAAPYLDNLAAADRARAWTARPAEDPFPLLDQMMAEQNIDTLMASSPLNVQELAGIPAGQQTTKIWAVYPRQSPFVHVLARYEVPWVGLPEAALADRDSVLKIAGGGTIGYDELDLSQRAFDGFGLGGVSAAPASMLLRRWRERRCWQDLAYYVIAAQVTREAIDAAISLTEAGMASGEFARELDAYERYRAVVADHVGRLPIRIRTYFTHTHAGDRTHIPASASTHRIGRDTSLKIDAGLEVYDQRGYLRAASDVTRSAVGTPAARHFRDLLDHALTESAIAACRPGATGSAIFEAGLDPLEVDRGWLTEEGFCPPSDRRLTELFGRDIGHLLGKQEPATCVFEPKDTSTVEAGMMAAAEIQWPYRRYCVGVEDNFLITDDGAINLTRTVRAV